MDECKQRSYAYVNEYSSDAWSPSSQMKQLSTVGKMELIA